MSECEKPCAPSDDFNHDKPASEQPQAALPDVSTNGQTPQFPRPVQPGLPGPEIPNAEVSESSVFTVRIGHTEVYETAEVVFGLGLGLDEARPIEWLWPGRIPLGTVTVLEGATETGKSLIAADLAARVTRGAPWPGEGVGSNVGCSSDGEVSSASATEMELGIVPDGEQDRPLPPRGAGEEDFRLDVRKRVRTRPLPPCVAGERDSYAQR